MNDLIQIHITTIPGCAGVLAVPYLTTIQDLMSILASLKIESRTVYVTGEHMPEEAWPSYYLENNQQITVLKTIKGRGGYANSNH